MIFSEIISKIFGISPEILEIPYIFTDFLIPLFLFSYLLYSLTRKIFKSKVVNAILAFCISFFTVIFNIGMLLACVSILSICMLKIKGAKGIVIGIFLLISYIIFRAWLISWISELISPTYYLR